MMQQTEISGSIEAFTFLYQAILSEQCFDFLMTILGQFDVSLFFIDIKITRRGSFFIEIFLRSNLGFQLRNQSIYRSIQIRTVFNATRNYQRRSRFVDKNRVHFIDDGVMQTALNTIFGTECHVVSQVIEAKLVIRTVGDIRLVGRLFFLQTLTGIDHTNRHIQRGKQRSHPLSTPFCQVVIDCHQMHTTAFQGI